MSGRRALWLPGTDHAGIATQMMVERQLASEGKKRTDLGREKFVERVWEWRKLYGGAILDQMKRLGASVDWSREYFTMDEGLSVAVREAFVSLYEQGLIYRGAYIVNWCPRCQTAISDLEVVYGEEKGHLWEIRYPILDAACNHSGEFITVATTRPETMLGDTAVAVHPDDERYQHLKGRRLRVPLVNRSIPIVFDDYVSPEFGTGAVKVTPAHDPNDFAIGERHHLSQINIMDTTGHINEAGDKYAGLDRYEARKRILEDLEKLGLLVSIKDHVHNVGHCDRCKTTVEPRLSTQWFVAVNKEIPGRGGSMAGLARRAVTEGHIKFTPEMYEKTYLSWMENIHDWCISRQLWWGHRIPAWHCSKCHKITVSRQDPTECAHCGSKKIVQETDVLDTWFSSGLLPVSVFGWPRVAANAVGAPFFPRSSAERVGQHEPTRADFDAFYPTSVLVTGFDILFFWVARMVMMGCWFSTDVPMPDGSKRELKDSVPFREVYIHALVRDANREKMSKTKGNVIDPIGIVKQYGTDAVRFTLASMASPGTDIAFNVGRTEGYRAFANKIWNAARFLFMNVDRAAEIGIKVDPKTLGSTPVVAADAPLEARWIVAELNATITKVNASLENYRYDDAASAIYQFIWGGFCDWYLEIVKLRLNFEDPAKKAETAAALTTLVQVFEASLRLLSPFMPFLTEELWHAVYDGQTPAVSVALTRFPVAGAIDQAAVIEMEDLQKVVTSLRALRKDAGVPEKERIPAQLHAGKPDNMEGVRIATAIRFNQDIVRNLARVSEVTFPPKLTYRHIQSESNFDVAIDFEKQIDVPAERERLTKDIAKFEKGLAAADRQLSNAGFLAKAPAQVVEGLKKQATETRLLLKKAQTALAALPKA
jgi:valyl-tRNA synthetase